MDKSKSPTVRQDITNKGRIEWQKASGYSTRSRIKAAIDRYDQVTRDGLRFHENKHRITKVRIAVYVLNRILELGRPISVRIA